MTSTTNVANIAQDTLQDDDRVEWIHKIELRLASWWQNIGKYVKIIVALLLFVGYWIYFGFAMHYSFEKNGDLIVYSVLLVLIVLLWMLHHFHGYHHINKAAGKVKARLGKHYINVKRAIMVLIALGALAFIIWSAWSQPYRLVSVSGVLFFTLVAFVCSKNPAKVIWHPYFMGLIIQFLFGLLVLRWSRGFGAFQWAGTKLTTFLTNTDAGTAYVFGENLAGSGTAQFFHVFAFVVLPSIIFFGAITELGYYYGIVQICIRYLGKVMDTLMGVAPAEAFVAAANIFLGPNVSAMTVSSVLPDMTLSELHCVMTSGYSTVTGSLFALYVSLGVPSSYLIAASVMSAPAALAVAKIFWPETGVSVINNTDRLEFKPSTSSNSIMALMEGAMEGAAVVIQVMANLIAFVAILQFLNSSLEWFGMRVGREGVTFEWVLSYVFYPIPFFMGVPLVDCSEVSRILGIKIMLTEIVGYEQLGELINNRELGLTPALSSQRSEVIAAFALCGFGSLPDIAICLGALSAIVPSRKSDLSRVAFRAMIAGNLTCYITASIAGILFVSSSST